MDCSYPAIYWAFMLVIHGEISSEHKAELQHIYCLNMLKCIYIYIYILLRHIET